jgi:hypothetical protein
MVLSPDGIIEMKSVEENLITAMDGSDIEHSSYLHYILQDLWKMGTDPDIVMKLIENPLVIPHDKK